MEENVVRLECPGEKDVIISLAREAGFAVRRKGYIVWHERSGGLSKCEMARMPGEDVYAPGGLLYVSIVPPVVGEGVLGALGEIVPMGQLHVRPTSVHWAKRYTSLDNLSVSWTDGVCDVFSVVLEVIPDRLYVAFEFTYSEEEGAWEPRLGEPEGLFGLVESLEYR